MIGVIWIKRVSDVADELGVSRVTVYNHIKRLSKEIKEYVYNDEGVKVIDDKGIKMIKASIENKEDLQFYFTDEDEKSEDTENDNVKELLKEQVNILKEEVKRLEKELETKNKQIDRLNNQVESFHMMIRSKEEKIYQLEGEVEEQNKSILDKVKDFFKN